MKDFLKWPKRVLLFVGTNILIVVTLSLLLRVTGLDSYLYQSGFNYGSLAVFCLFWGMGGAFISLGLSRIMAKMAMGVRVIDPAKETHPSLRALVSRVHDLSRKAGLKVMPEVGYYESPELNAFATGPTRNRSLVAVSSGLLNRMSEDEVEGVLAHEVAHIANGDMVTMTLIQGIMNAFVMFLARIIAFAISNALAGNRDSDRRESSPFMNMMIVFVLEMVLSVFATMVVMAFSRWREYRADAGGASLAGRGKMIAALQALKRNFELPPGAADGASPSLATLKISGRKPSALARFFTSHPPLDERVAALQRVTAHQTPSYVVR